ncbi:fibrobacter succinogenes major paralogous domain-containing protein [Psychroserpens ponticola]|uniref:Fibrobacter succinogenes major paralogous domain-containing protein n=1 Tax=Psychroserpens ponticola TaxID=2932268 RepID=A0ABY7S030_9FLAO|nr:fibrobacter succinogenes major paralogous domain-containing protein [Psychroserpens ponticola]WCO02755.1 fibrobacter succinogenes major paralogous domain-containing protein [Psychroserpens ponticola]
MKQLFRLALLVISIFIIVLSCSKDDSTDSTDESTNSNLTVYKNQTGDFNADALQAQHKDSNGTFNFYGHFDGDNNPTTINTLTYQKVNNDTIVNLIVDPLTSRITNAYTSVNGVKSDVVIKYDYPSNTHMSVSFHQYDWSNNSSEIIYGVNLETPFNSENRFSSDVGWNIGALLSGILIVEAGSAIAGGVTIGIFAGIGTVAAAAIAAPLIATTFALAIASAFIPSDAFSSELLPSDLPYPEDTPILNPVTSEEDPTPNLTPFDCSATFIAFTPVMQYDGTIVIEDINEGISPYLYLVETEIRTYPIFPNNYEDGGYEVCLRDANGCITCRYVTLQRECLEVTTTTTSNSATAIISSGQPPYTYLWNNGSTNNSITNLTEGTYTVTVSDEAGCTGIGNAVIVNNDIETVVIGTQEWMLKNLDVSMYRNGDPIPQVTDLTTWSNLTTGAWCYYANNSTNGLVYGKLYNAYAVNDSRGLAPEGWHVPSDTEWEVLSEYLGGASEAGGKLKSTSSLWDLENTGATNSSGFTGLPAGLVDGTNGFVFNLKGKSGWFWSSTLDNMNPQHNWFHLLSTFHDDFYGGQYPQNYGMSVRCIRD